MARNVWKSRGRVLAVVLTAVALGIVAGYLLLQVTIMRWSAD